MKVAIIPARGGSKRIPKKNIKLFHSKPMIGWSIEAAKASGCFDKILVSTDNDEIACTARQWGAETPFVRPANLADDYTGTIPVIAHAVQWLEAHAGIIATEVCCIYATAPFICPTDIKKGLEEISRIDIDYSFSATSYPYPIQRALRMTKENGLEMLNPENFLTRSQDLEEVFHDAGQFYWGKSMAWTKNLPIFSKRSMPIIIPRHRVQDIDTEEDWIRAELMFSALQQLE